MSNRILKNFRQPSHSAYVFQPAAALQVDEEPEIPVPEAEDGAEAEMRAEPTYDPSVSREENEISYAQYQADAILRDAHKEADALREEARQEAEAELDELREQGRQEGFNAGYAEGMARAMEEARQEAQERAARDIRQVQEFLSAAARERDLLFEENREAMKDLALAIAEKVIRVSLKNSTDIILRMVDAATDTHKRCEWAHIYVADCDMRGKVYTMPELTEALGHISERIRVIPMTDDETGTCIIELPDVILDASVSTQLGKIKEVISSTGTD